MSNKALVVGIDEYAPPNQLPSCVADATSFADMLKAQYGFTNIRTLLNQQARKDDLIENLNSLFEGASENDRLVFFYSGHGYTPVVDKVAHEALVSQDGQFFFDDDLAAAMKDIPPGILTIVLDACFSGGMLKPWIAPNGDVQMVRIKCWQPGDKSFIAAPKGYAPFGHLAPLSGNNLASNFAGIRLISAQADARDFQETTLQSPAAKGLLLTACLSDEEAAASRPSTNGLSAFTFSLLQSIKSLGNESSAEKLIEAAGNKLHQDGIRQTPMLKEPMVPPHLGKANFLLLGGTGKESLSASPLIKASNLKGNGGDPPATAQSPNSEEHDMNVTQNQSLASVSSADIETIVKATLPYILRQSGNVASSQPRINDAASKGWFDDVTHIVSTVVPVVLSALQSKGYQPQQQPSASTDKSWFDDVTHIVSTVVPVVLSALQSKGYQPQQQPSASTDKSWFDDVTHIVSTVVPVVLSALQSKGYQPQQQPSASTDKSWFDDVTHIVSTVVPVVLSALQSKGYQPQQQPSASMDKSWFDDVTHIVSTVVPVVLSALQSKGYQPQQQPSASMDKSWFDDVTHIVSTVVPVVLSALQSKGYQPQPYDSSLSHRAATINAVLH